MTSDLGEIDVPGHIKYSFFKLWGMSAVGTIIGFASGVFT